MKWDIFPYKQNRRSKMEVQNCENQDFATYYMKDKIMPSPIDVLGYLPITGQIVAVLRAGHGILKFGVSVIMQLFNKIFTGNSNGWGNSALDALLHTGRACVEIVPILGGILTFAYDNGAQKAAFEFFGKQGD
jgi:hypothetical protein